MMRRKLTVAVLAAMAALGSLAGPAAAGCYCGCEPPSKQHCNAGRGNGSEGCDPGNSEGHNFGGDEGGPIHGGTAAP